HAPHAAEYIKNSISLPGAIQSTIDLECQDILEEHLESYLQYNNSFGVYNGSILLLDYSSMEVLGAVGSADFFDDSIEGQVNGFTAKRSPGSTLKPFIYALAMEQEIIHPNTMLKDAPTSFGEYTPDNFQSDFKGPVKAWEALVHSRNIPAITLAESINNPDLYDFLESADVTGLKERGHYGLSIVLGSAEVTMLELVKLYAMLANEGNLKDISFIMDKSPGKSGYSLLSPESSILTNRMLQKNPSPLEFRPKEVKNIPIAYKTGTSIGFKDCWSIAIFDRFVLCVWIGNFDGKSNPAFLGRKMAAPLLFSIADTLLMDIPEEDRYIQPFRSVNISEIEVCSVSGGIPNEHCPNSISTEFIPVVSPIKKCQIHREIYIDTRTGFRTTELEGESVIRVVREFWSSDLLEQFERAGLPRLVPPPLMPSGSNISLRKEGSPPGISSPLKKGVYIIRQGTSNHKSIPLVASVDADVSEIFWFA
ncbi:MAG: penicillin-binding protein 1C, partial [Spirochaetales bacterium]|nr:penicillin-binding protein 1C [Spirochaetales bacterium]